METCDLLLLITPTQGLTQTSVETLYHCCRVMIGPLQLRYIGNSHPYLSVWIKKKCLPSDGIFDRCLVAAAGVGGSAFNCLPSNTLSWTQNKI